MYSSAYLEAITPWKAENGRIFVVLIHRKATSEIVKLRSTSTSGSYENRLTYFGRAVFISKPGQASPPCYDIRMNSHAKIPVNRADDDELLGFVIQDKLGWIAQTIFGYEIARASDESAAARIVREQGLSFLTGIWQYLDPDDRDWYPCVLREVYEHRVIVMRTNKMGHPDPDDYKVVTIKEPSELNLAKS